MIITTTETISGKKVVKTLGLVKGNTIRARHVGRDIVAGFRNIIGGEIREYTKMLAESREQALDRMQEEAKKLGANAVVGMRFITASIIRYSIRTLFEEDMETSIYDIPGSKNLNRAKSQPLSIWVLEEIWCVGIGFGWHRCFSKIKPVSSKPQCL